MFELCGITFTCAVPPAYLQGLEIMAAEEVLDSKILKFDEKFNGILIAYQDLQFRDSQGVGLIQDEQPDVLFEFRVNLLIYSPKKHENIKAVVSDIQPGHITLLTNGVFPIVVLSKDFPNDTKVPTGKKKLINTINGDIVLNENDECIVKCLRILHQGGELHVEASLQK
jgi:hypothetical protein